MRRNPPMLPVLLLLIGILMLAHPAARAALLSKTFVFRADTTLEIGVDVEIGLRVDSVRFSLPSSMGGRLLRVGGLAQAQVAVSNTSEESKKVGIAIALFDDENRLLGVASGGVKLMPLRPNRQATYTLAFENVNAEIHRATKFQLSVEPKR